MSDEKVYGVAEKWRHAAWVDTQAYRDWYRNSIADPDTFWAEHGQRIDWFKRYTQVRDVDYGENARIRWFHDGTLNAAYNCLDRHLELRSSQVAIIWEGDEPGDSRRITYGELHAEVSRFGNVLKSLGVERGDRVAIYLPMIPEAVVAMLACARIGAVHSVVFGGFSADSLASRMIDCDATVLVTADEGVRGGRRIPLKAMADEALMQCPGVTSVVVLRRTGARIGWTANRDLSYRDLMAQASSNCPAEEMDAEDPLFILYTSGSTGKPKGVLHTTGGYLVFTSLTHEYVFDYHPGDVFWCTADVGWVTGHSYICYGPLANGATTLMFEGVPTYPDPSRFWHIVDKYKVNIFYTAPTALRALMREGDEWVSKTSRKSLRVLGNVGEPINPEVWEWYYRVVGGSRCPIVDTWWQTETGGVMISPLPGATKLKPGSAAVPFFGVQPVIVDEDGHAIEGPGSGYLCLADGGPGMMRTVFRNHEAFVDTYFRRFSGKYFTGDAARRDDTGYYWITGRVDDVINVSGHRLGTAEIESAIVAHAGVAEAAVVGFAHDLKGQGIYAYVTVRAGLEPDDTLRQELVERVRSDIGHIATPDVIHWSQNLPKTRSGKIMRRILRKLASGEYEDLGDTSTLANPSVIERLVEECKETGKP